MLLVRLMKNYLCPLPVHMEPPVDPVFEAEDVVDSSVIEVVNGVQGHQGVVESPDAVPPMDTPPKHPYNVRPRRDLALPRRYRN